MAKGRRRKRDIESGDGCCHRFCEKFCRLSKWNQLLCYGMLALGLMTLILFIGGAILASAASDFSDVFGTFSCQRDSGSNATTVDPNVPLYNDNFYVWYLARTGLIILMMLFASCVCYMAFVGLCCGDFGKPIRKASYVGFCIVTSAVIVYCVWLGTGTYFLVLLDPGRLSNSICRNFAFYMGFLYIYLFVFLILCIIACLWRAHKLSTQKDKKSKGVQV